MCVTLQKPLYPDRVLRTCLTKPHTIAAHWRTTNTDDSPCLESWQIPISHRVRVVDAAPRWARSSGVIRRDDVRHCTVASSDDEELSHHYDKTRPGSHELCFNRAVRAAEPVVMQPHVCVGDDCRDRDEECANERDERAEDGDGTGDDVADNDDPEDRADPGDPVPW